MRNAVRAARATGVPVRNMQNHFARLRLGESLDDRPRAGRPRVNTSNFRRRLAQVKHTHARASTAVLTREMCRLQSSSVSLSTVRRALHDLDYKWRLTGRKKLTPIQMSARIAFARECRDNTWREVWCADEAYFNLYRNSKRCWVKVSTEEATAPARLTRDQEKISVAVLAIVSRESHIALSFLPRGWNASDLKTVFRSDVYPAYRAQAKLGDAPPLVLDNDGRHHSPAWTSYVARSRIRVVPNWPPNSPDLNPIENVFAWMKDFVEARAPASEQSLRDLIQEAWLGYPVDSLKKLFDSMPERIAEVERNGGRRLKH